MPPTCAISSLSKPYTILCLAGCIFDLKASDVMTTRKWVSLEVLPCIALWCECKCESLYISSVVGARAAVIFARIASSMGVIDWAMVDMSLRRAPIATRGNIKNGG